MQEVTTKYTDIPGIPVPTVNAMFCIGCNIDANMQIHECVDPSSPSKLPDAAGIFRSTWTCNGANEEAEATSHLGLWWIQPLWWWK